MAASVRVGKADITSTPNSFTLDVQAGDYIVASVCVKQFGSGPTLNTPTVDGNAMTPLIAEQSVPSHAYRTRLYGYEVPSTATVTVSASVNDGGGMSLIALAWQDCASSPISGVVFGGSSGANMNLTVSSATGDTVGMHVDDIDSRALTPGTGSTSVTGTGLNSSYAWALYEAGAASVTVGGSYPSTTDAWGFGYSVAPASGGGGGGGTEFIVNMMY